MHPVVGLMHRNAWATERLLNWCLWQPPGAAPSGDVYGDIEANFNHILAAETRYLSVLTGERPEDPVDDRAPRPLTELREPGRELYRRWRAVYESERDIEELRVHKRRNSKQEMPDW